MKRILVFGMTENPGGVESFLMNYYRNINKENIQFDFLCNSHDPVAYEDELIALGARTFHITARSKNRSIYRKELKETFDKHASEWQALWVNVSSLANIDYLIMAKEYGIKKRIIHSHNSQNMDSKLRGILHQWNRSKIAKYATDFWACSEDAAKWFYDETLLPKVVLIHNAIDVNQVAFDAAKRQDIRSELHFTEEEYVIGNVGRLHFQKNQSFILDIFQEFIQNHPEARLVFVGQGEDEQSLKEKCKALALEEKVVFAGVQSNVDAWLSAFDLFLFPSVFEGLSVAALEAQANGVPFLASKGVVPEEVRMNDNFVFYSLEESPKQWAQKIEEMQTYKRPDPEQIRQNFINKGYEIRHEVGKLERLLGE